MLVRVDSNGGFVYWFLKLNMSLVTFPITQRNLPQFLFAILFGLGYLNYFYIKEPISYFFQISSLAGQILVNKFLAICAWTFEIVKLTFTFFQILYEDSLVFFKDATEKFAFAIHLLKELYLFLEGFGWSLLSTCFRTLESFYRFLEFLLYTIVDIKLGFQLTGSAIWRFFTSLPETVILHISAVIEFIKDTVIEIKNSVVKFHEKIFECLQWMYYFLFYVPFDSACGLVIGAVLMIVFYLKFKDICYLTTSAFFKLYRQAISFVNFLWSGRFLEKKRRFVDYNPEDDERLCIICQHKPKEMIIFPCKHLCLCGDCTYKLTRHQALCPMCRGDITGTLKVYM